MSLSGELLTGRLKYTVVCHRCSLRPLSVLVTVLKHQTFRDVKLALAECVKIESKPNDIILMESINSRINRKLVSITSTLCVYLVQYAPPTGG